MTAVVFSLAPRIHAVLMPEFDGLHEFLPYIRGLSSMKSSILWSCVKCHHISKVSCSSTFVLREVWKREVCSRAVENT